MYPEPVVEVAKVIYDIFEDVVLENTDRSKEWCKDIGVDTVSEFLLPKFLKGEELQLKEEEVFFLLTRCVTNIALESLKEKGLVDMIEDEDGEEVVFLTKKGKERSENLTEE